MKYGLLPIMGTLAIVFFMGCSAPVKKQLTDISRKAVTDSASDHAHNSANSIDWEGLYKGTLPCADCEGIETEIILNRDQSFVKRTKYLGKSQNSIEVKGSFTWNEGGNVIRLNEITNQPNQYQVGENKIIQLDREGKKISGGLAEKYVLKKF